MLLHICLVSILVRIVLLVLLRCTRSSTFFGGLIHQGGNTKYKGVSKMYKKSMLEAVKEIN